MTNETLVQFFLIWRDMILFHEAADTIQNRLILFHTKQTVLLLNDSVGPACIKACDDTSVFIFSKRELGFIAVTPRLVHADDRLHRNLGQSANAA